MNAGVVFVQVVEKDGYAWLWSMDMLSDAVRHGELDQLLAGVGYN